MEKMSDTLYEIGQFQVQSQVPVEVKPSELRIPCEVYSRVVGYLRPVQNWNAGKQQEFRERRNFQVTDQD